MKLGIMQPYFFPYLGYYCLIKHTDDFILFDTVQFIRHGWIERNRILKQNEGWLYIQVPLIKAPQQTLIKDMQINNNLPWKNKILSQLQVYKKKAPFYYTVLKLINQIFENEYHDIVLLNKDILKITCDYLGFNRDFKIFSQMGLNIETVREPDEWALNICKAIDGVEEYWNPPGGQLFFDKSKYEENNITLKFQSIELVSYDQKQTQFEPGLSIIDVVMFNSVEDINKMLENYTIKLL